MLFLVRDPLLNTAFSECKGWLIFKQTTNRLGVIDTAIMSRIQVAIEYPDFDVQKRKDLWKSLFHKLRKDENANTKVSITQDLEDTFLDHEILNEELNGREIRNGL